MIKRGDLHEGGETNRNGADVARVILIYVLCTMVIVRAFLDRGNCWCTIFQALGIQTFG